MNGHKVYLEAITTCLNYSDFLTETLPFNRSHFDKLVVVTGENDAATQKLCQYYHVQCVLADFGSKGEFHKGTAINAGLEQLSKAGWVVHLDADIALPAQTRSLIENAQLDPTCLYGIDRFLIQSYKTWKKQVKNPKLQHEAGTYVHTNSYPIATRFMSHDYRGYIPIGFFQMWDPAVSNVLSYPTAHTDAGRTDMLFARNWTRNRRQLIPEFVAYHLESEVGPQGLNWSGRTSKPFEDLSLFSRIKHRCHRKPRHCRPPKGGGYEV